MAKLNKRLQAAGFAYSTAAPSSARPHTPASDAAGQFCTASSLLPTAAAHACGPLAHTSAAVIDTASTCTACASVQQQMTTLIQAVAAMHAALQQVCARQ